MDKTLKNLYIRLDRKASTLTKAALQQIIIKLLFSQDHPISSDNLFELYKNALKRKDADRKEFEDLLVALYESNEISSTKSMYSLPKGKLKKIKRACEESSNRLDDIIERYFSNTMSDSDAVKGWLQDVTIHFFKLYSNDWISDLVNDGSVIESKKRSIHDMVVRRTENYKGINKHDYEKLVDSYYRFLTSGTDPKVAAFLWEYATSAFSALLISNKKGVDLLTIDSFRDSTCLLDTNILIYIALETSVHHKAIESIEHAFEVLGMKVGALHITTEEYQRRVGSQRDVTISNLERYGYDTIADAEDEFTKTAIARGCEDEAAFKRFFDQIYKVPEFVKNSVKIEIIDDASLDEIVTSAQNDSVKVNNFQKNYTEATGHPKRPKPLMHDVGLVAGVEYLREESPYFILSEDFGINSFSKKKPALKHLPLSIRVTTLINVLAIDNGGVDFDADDYMSLFASIIKNGLQPDDGTYEQVDLYKMCELNENITKLPKDEVKRIAYNLHEKLLKGDDDNSLLLELDREITKGNIAVRKQLGDKDAVIAAL